MKFLTLRGSEWLRLPAKRREHVVETSFRYWRKQGFPHVRLSDAEIRDEYCRIAECPPANVWQGNEIAISPTGLRLANAFHPHMWRVPMRGVRTPYDRFKDDLILRCVIRKALRVFPERMAVNASNLRRILQTYSRTGRVSNFRPTAAKALYARYSGSGDTVLDFSSGYGGRLLGCLTLPRHYVGIDPCGAQVRGLQRMIAKLERLVAPASRATLYQACAEEQLGQMPARSCSLVFSSPPYFDNERYSQEPTQSYRKFPDYQSWLEGFLRPVMAESHRLLEPGGYFIINTVNLKDCRLADDTYRLGARYFSFSRTYHLRLSQRPYLHESFGIRRSEPVFVFRKAARVRPVGGACRGQG